MGFLSGFLQHNRVGYSGYPFEKRMFNSKVKTLSSSARWKEGEHLLIAYSSPPRPAVSATEG